MNARITFTHSRRSSQPGKKTTGGTKGSILAPCLFLLSLMSILAMSTLYAGGIGTRTSAILAENTQVQLAAESGLKIAYQALMDDDTYLGETCTPLAESNCSVEITVTAFPDSEFEVLTHATIGNTNCLIRTKACLKPFGLYPLTVGNNITLKGKSKILGDCFLQGTLWGKDTSEVTGNVYLTGDREISYNLGGDPIMINGYPPPLIGGEVVCNVPSVDMPEVNFANLRSLAASAGQVFTGTIHIEDTHFDGVVYIEGSGSKPYFRDVTINGILVCDGTIDITIDNSGFFKIHSDPNICENVAILWQQPSAASC